MISVKLSTSFATKPVSLFIIKFEMPLLDKVKTVNPHDIASKIAFGDPSTFEQEIKEL